MKRAESSIIFTHCNAEKGIYTCIRLIRTSDIFHDRDVYSLFVTTCDQDDIDEEFVYDIAQDEPMAKEIFDRISKAHVTACTLLPVIHDILAEF